MSFGFGVGDMIVVSKLAIQARTALKESTGSVVDYQKLTRMRAHLGSSLAVFEVEFSILSGNSLPQSVVDETKLGLDECSQHLADIDEMTTKFKTSLGKTPGSTKTYKNIKHKLEWRDVRESVVEIFSLFQTRVSLLAMLLWVSHA